MRKIIHRVKYLKSQFGTPFVFLLIALFINCVVSAQSAIPETFQKNFIEYNKQSLQEKIFVHTDKSFYTAGEIIWFKIYEVDGYLHRPLDFDKLAYIEIITNDQKPVLQGKIELIKGTGDGSFMIPLSLNTGNYMLRAYTHWMKNFSPDYYFEKPITIVNSLKKPEWQKLESAADYSIQFFPEGGNLVYGLQSKVAFKAVNQFGKGIDCNGKIVNQNNDSITSFQALHFGMGNFLFTPLSGNNYKAIITLPDNRQVSQELPVIYAQGFVMNVSSMDNERLKVSVNATADNINLPVYLFAHTRQLIKAVQMKDIKNGKAEFIIDKNILEDGITHFTIFNTARQPLCERLYFKRPSKKLEIDIQTNQAEYASRKKVNLELITKNEAGQLVPADMSMSVFLVDSLQSLDQQDILSYLLLTSDLKGAIESPAYYLKNTNAEADLAMDNLMLTQGWRRFKWEDVMQNRIPSFEFLPEYEGLSINGKIIDKQSGNPANNITAYLSIPGERYQFSNTLSNQNGTIRFTVTNFYGNGEMVIQAKNSDETHFRIDISDPYSEKFSATPLPQFELPEKWKSQLALHHIGVQVQNTYVLANYQQFASHVLLDTTPFYGKPDNQYFLDDYTRFITMEEVIQEYVSEVRLKKNKGKFHFQVLNAPYSIYFENDPLILLDGVPVFDADKLTAFSPLKIKKLDVVARKHFMGKALNEGVVSFSTYDGDLGGFELNPDAVVLEYQGLQLRREFYSPVYELNDETQNRLPDFRNVLYWSPDIKTSIKGKNQLSFYTSDLPGRYAIFVQGITTDGSAGSSMVIFEVKK